MASLEDLLTEEGFRGGRMKSRSSFKAEAVNVPRHLRREQSSSVSPSNARAKTHRTKSDISRLVKRTELEKKDRARKPRDDLIRSKKLVDEPKNEVKEIEILEERDFHGIQEMEKYGVGASQEPDNNWNYAERYGGDYHDDERVYDHIEDATPEKPRYGNFYDFQAKETHKEKNRKERQQGEKNRSKYSKIPLSIKNSFSKNFRESGSLSKGTSNSSQQTKKFDDLQTQMCLTVNEVVSEPAIDEAAIQAMISILTGYIKQFLKFESFRESFQEKCASCLGFSSLRDQIPSNRGVMLNLTQAIDAIEKVAEELADPNELKKASIQLSVVAGLNSKDLKDGFTSGIPNSHLAACAHMYLSVIYKLQKKERVSAKHLLQVFCDSPFQARNFLLPDLWDHLFLPHLEHLRVWYDQEAEAIANTSSRLRKMELLEKVYNEIVDNGTHQFAVYYKEWLTDGVEAPSIPSIRIPTVSIHGISPGASRGYSPGQQSSVTNSVSSQPLISKRLYETVFGQSNSMNNSDGAKVGDGEESFTDCARSLDCNIEESGGSGDDIPKVEVWMEHQMQEDAGKSATVHEQSSVNEQLLILGDSVAIQEVKELEEEGGSQHVFQNISRNTRMLHGLSNTEANELTLKELAKAVFQLQQVGESIDSTIVDRPITKYSAGPKHIYDLFEENSFFSTVLKDFTCPLSGWLFEDPVTLETGQTFERVAIQEWFNQGNKTCPLTGRRLANVAVPVTNFVLKHIIDCWKSERCKNLLVYASQIAESSTEHGHKSKDETAIFILEQLLAGLKPEEITENTKHLISLGGLQFLIRRFELGVLDERTSVAALLSCCIKAEGSCRNDIARAINKSCLIELLHNKQVKSRTNAVLLLIELICLNRRTATTSFLSGLLKEGIMNTLHVLLVYLQSSHPEQKPLVAVLILHIDLLVEPQKYSIYREEAVDALVVALNCSLTNEKLRQQTSRALLIIGGHFSSSGELQIMTWLLKQAGFYDKSDAISPGNDDKVIQIDQMTTWQQDEDHAREAWLNNMAVRLLGNRKNSILEAISKCLNSQNPDLVGACLTTVAWLSRALTFRSETELQLSAFSVFVPWLKNCLDNDLLEYRVLASMTLLNFSEIPECRMLLSALAEDIAIPLSKLTNVTWTAKKLILETGNKLSEVKPVSL
ncbi:putative E3 ubiquitin-protein ligase LIN-1 [Aristolochia californica]|uniref:putative E3 ubiquitin-protein ligase LIN-1 n=1 Tax=Aristolochia californica TaxID=171875 RepID=UPI0035D7DA58